MPPYNSLQIHVLLLRWAIGLAVALLAPLLSAQTYHVRAGASGQGSGLNWNDAYSALPATLVRGATYYVADGTYGAYKFDDATSGTALITIKKATQEEHGADQGWQASFGDGEALFSSGGDVWVFTTGYYKIDGVVGSGKNPRTYGFRLYSTSSRAAQNNLIYYSGAGPINGNQILHVELDWDNGSGTSAEGVTRAFDSGTASHSGTTFQHCYVHHSSGFHFFILTSSNMKIDHCYFYRNGGGGGVNAHWESFWFTYGSNLTFSNNVLDDTIGTQGQTGWLMLGDMHTVKIFGNVFMGSSASTSTGNNGTIATWSNDSYQCSDIYIINNTFIDLNTNVFATPTINFFHNSVRDTNIVCKNNLYYNSDFGWNGITSHSHEAAGGGQSINGSSAQSGISTSNFIDYASDNFRLATATNQGDSSVGGDFALDPDGRTRGADGNWDRGAFEYSAGTGETTPTGPTVLQLTP